jgi:hypothetical protein
VCFLNTEIENLKRIPRMEDDPQDAELTPAAMEEPHPANLQTGSRATANRAGLGRVGRAPRRDREPGS